MSNNNQQNENNNASGNQNTQTAQENNQSINNQSQQQSTNNQSQQNNQNTGGTGANSRMFTQEQVSAMMANEKNQGRAAALRDIGIDPSDQNMVGALKAFMESYKTPEQKSQEQLNQQQIKLAEAENRAKRAEAKAEAMQLGLNGKYVDDAIIIIMSKVDDKTDVKTVVSELKTKYPTWFDGSNDEGTGDNGANNNQQKNQNNQTGKNGTGSSVGNSSNNSNNSGNQGLGARLAAQRKGNKNTKSFWS